MPAAAPPREIVRWSSNKNDGRNTPTTLIALHESVGITNAWDLALFCERQGVSYHDIADNTQMVHAVRFSDTAWHLRSGNPDSVGLCLTTPVAGYSRAEWLGPQVTKVQIAAWWVARSCHLLNVPIRDLSFPQIRSALTGNRASAGVTTHNNYTLATQDGTHTDPRNFPMDVCLEWADGIPDPPEDDMAAVPQTEWNLVRDNVNKMANGPDTEQAMSRADGGYIHNQVWSHILKNYKQEQVAVGDLVVALELRMNQMELAILELLKRSGGVPDDLK